MFKGFLLQIVLISTFCCSGVFAQCTKQPQPLPAGFSAYLVLEADDTVTGDVADDPTFFHTTLLNRNQAQIDQLRADAVAFFASEYGLTVLSNDVVMNSSGTPVGLLRETMLNQDTNFRVISAGEQYVPTSGWPAFLRRHWVEIVNPQGTTLGGNYFGPNNNFVEEGTSISYGEIYIIQEDDCGTTGTTFNYTYKSLQPVVPDYQARGVLRYGVDGVAGAPNTNAFARAEANGGDVLVRWILKGKS